jgi:hypothetical protein
MLFSCLLRESCKTHKLHILCGEIQLLDVSYIKLYTELPVTGRQLHQVVHRVTNVL